MSVKICYLQHHLVFKKKKKKKNRERERKKETEKFRILFDEATECEDNPANICLFNVINRNTGRSFVSILLQYLNE